MHPLKVLGEELDVELSGGSRVRAAQLNNAATTPPLTFTMQRLEEYLSTYGALHRGAGPRARKTYAHVARAVENIRAFLGLGEEHALLFTENTSAAVNWLARLLALDEDTWVVSTEIEHTSNNLPWRYTAHARVAEVPVDSSGAMTLEDLESTLSGIEGRVALVALSGASNMTGFVPDLAGAARLAHQAGAKLFVDAAQLAPHRPIDVQRDGIDVIAFSGHKVYAPFGLGVLALPKALLDRAPVHPGGGSIDMLSAEGVIWAPASARHQTGTWNTTGIVAVGASCEALMPHWEGVMDHERRLCVHAANRLEKVPGLVTYVPWDEFRSGARIGTIPFNLPPYHHAHLAAILDHEFGIEVRAGTICNHRLVRRWCAIDDATHGDIERQIENGDRLASYGIVRASFGLHTKMEDVDRLADALESIQKHGSQLDYRPIPEVEVYEPVGPEEARP